MLRSWKLASLAELLTIWSEIETLPPGMDGLQVGTGWQKGPGHTEGKQSPPSADGREVKASFFALSFL